MGDISTHHKVALHVVRQLKAVAPDENYTYLVLGNFLTDVSQFRDPTAYIGAKRSIVANKASLFWRLVKALNVGNIRVWLDEVMGRADSAANREGALVRYFTYLAYFSTHLFFNPRSILAYYWHEENSDLKSISTVDINQAFDNAYTQYYPHEHLDFPPLVDRPRPMHQPLYRRPKNGLISYLQNFSEYIVTELTKLEFDWRSQSALPPTDPSRYELLLRLGHTLHAVEDFFFHSNVHEVRHWDELLRLNTGKNPQNREDRRFLLNQSLLNTASGDDLVLYQRRFARRLRYPAYNHGDDFYADLSIDASDFVYTGSFGRKDVYHTLGAGLHAIEHTLDDAIDRLTADWKAQLETKIRALPLLAVLLRNDERRLIAGSATQMERRIAAHAQQLRDESYVAAINDLTSISTPTRQIPLFPKEARDGLLHAYALDREIQLKYPSVVAVEPATGVGGFLFSLAAEIYNETEASSSQSIILNHDSESIYDDKAVNGASAETIGTHSLMSKDGVEKNPFRDYAVGLAQFASSSIALLLLKYANSSANVGEGLDWSPIVRHLMRFPSDQSECWEKAVLDAMEANEPIPSLDDVADKVPQNILHNESADGLLRLRRSSPSKGFWESWYQALEKRVEW